MKWEHDDDDDGNNTFQSDDVLMAQARAQPNLASQLGVQLSRIHSYTKKNI